MLLSLLQHPGGLAHGQVAADSRLVWLHVTADALTALAYFTIPFTLLYFVRRRRDLPFNGMFLCFATFIVACGLTHLMGVWTTWVPSWWTSGVVKVVTAVASIGTAVALVQLLPKALALPSPAQLAAANAALGAEVRRREAVEAELRLAHGTLERRVTERTADLGAANAALRESEERFRLLVEHVRDYAISMLDPEGRVVTWNAGAERIRGYRAEEILGEHLSRFYPPEAVAAGKPARDLARAVAEGSYAEEGWRVRGDGTRFMASAVISVLRNERGGLRGFAEVTRDITERRRAEEELRRSEARFRATFEQAAVGMARVALDGRWLRVNQALCDIVGYSRDELLGLTFQDITHPDDLEMDLGELRRLLAGEIATYSIEKRYIRRDGTAIWIYLTVSLVREPDGSPDYCIAVVENIQARKEAEERLQRTEQQLLHAQKLEAVGRLAGGIAHDFNNLLTVINGLSLGVARQLPEGAPLRADVGEIHRAGERAAVLTSQLLAFSRRQVLRPEVLDLNLVVRDVERLLGRLIGEDLTVRRVLAADLGRVRADRGQLEQVIVNLALNARDAMPQGGTLTIETANVEVDGSFASERLAIGPGPHVVLAVSDSGVGMDAATQAHIFEPFFTTKPQGKGTGLGLSTVYGIVQQSGGGIYVYSEPGRGSTFKIYLPRVDEAQGPAPLPMPTPARGAERILIVEDDPSVRRFTARVLQDFGYEVLEAASGEEALQAIHSVPQGVDLVLTDVIMPGMSGPELGRRLAALSPGPRVVYMSGYTDVGVHEAGFGSTGVLVQKPFTPEGLARQIRQVLDRSRAQQRAR